MSFGVNSFGVGSFGSLAEVSGGGSSVTLTIQDTAQSQTLEAFSLSSNGASDLGIQDVSQAQSIANATLSIIPAVDFKVAILGDSNASGRGSFSQTNSASNAWLYDVSGNIVTLADPWDSGSDTYSVLSDSGSAGGSYVQHLADLLSAAGKSTLWIPANKGGIKASDWAYSTNTTTCYGAMKARIDAAGGADVIIIHLGANDAIIGHLVTDFPTAKIYLQKIHHNSSATTTNIDNIRAAVDDIWNGSSGCRRGADLEGISTGVHYGQTGNTTTCTSELNEVALRTFNAAFGAGLVVQDIGQAQAVSSVTLAIEAVLNVADIGQSQSIDAISLSAATTLSISDLFQDGMLENVSIYDDSSLNLQIFSVAQMQEIDSIALSSSAWLSISGMGQASQISHVTLSLPGQFVRAPAGSGPSIIRPVGQRPPNTGGQRI
jgi:lysophospholipase L1-like esterase